MLPLVPVALGIAALATLLSGCGSDNNSTSGTPRDGGDSGAGGSGATSTTGGVGGNSGTNGSGGSSTTGGSSGLGGSGGVTGDGGMAGIGDGGTDAGGMGGVGGDGGSPDAGNPIQVPYHFGMIYGSSSVKALNGTGTLLFSNLDPCQLLGGNFNAVYQTAGSPFQMTVDLPSQSIDFCSGSVTLPLAGGVFEGVSWLLTNKSDPLTSKQSWQITACSPETAGGAEKCSGALELTTTP